jgi:hypothetical protein
MAVMNKSELKKLVEGQFVVMDKSQEVMRRHLPDIAIASHGNDHEALQDVLGPYLAELEELVDVTTFFSPKHRTEALDYIEWLRSL